MVEELPDEMAGQLIKMICKHEFSGEVSESDPIVTAIFKGIKPSLDMNTEKYQKKVERMNENREKRRSEIRQKSDRNQNDINMKLDRKQNDIMCDTDTETDTDTVLSKDNINIVGKPDYDSDIKQIVDYLNEKSQSQFKPKTEATRKSIIARLKEGYTVDDFKRVIDSKVKDWSDSSMREYLRPQTLFRPANFEAYLNEANRPDKKGKKNSFSDYPQNTYDFAELERKLIKN